MSKNPVVISWKNSQVLEEVHRRFPGGMGEAGDERFKRIVKEFLEGANIFPYKPGGGQEGSSYTVTIDLKKVKVVVDARRDHRPLCLIKLNGVALMLCRHEPTAEFGVLFKITSDTDMIEPNFDEFERQVKRYNNDYDVLERHKQSEEERVSSTLSGRSSAEVAYYA